MISNILLLSLILATVIYIVTNLLPFLRYYPLINPESELDLELYGILANIVNNNLFINNFFIFAVYWISINDLVLYMKSLAGVIVVIVMFMVIVMFIIIQMRNL